MVSMPLQVTQWILLRIDKGFGVGEWLVTKLVADRGRSSLLCNDSLRRNLVAADIRVLGLLARVGRVAVEGDDVVGQGRLHLPDHLPDVRQGRFVGLRVGNERDGIGAQAGTARRHRLGRLGKHRSHLVAGLIEPAAARFSERVEGTRSHRSCERAGFQNAVSELKAVCVHKCGRRDGVLELDENGQGRVGEFHDTLNGPEGLEDRADSVRVREEERVLEP